MRHVRANVLHREGILFALERGVEFRQLVEPEIFGCKADVVRDPRRLPAETIKLEAHRDDRVVVRPDRTRLIIVWIERRIVGGKRADASSRPYVPRHQPFHHLLGALGWHDDGPQTVSRRHRQLVTLGQLKFRCRQWIENLWPTGTADFSPDLEFFGPGCSVLGGSDMIAAEMEEVVDLIVG